MSWCRWSTDIDNRCSSDLYIYDHVDGYVQVHVAGRRRANYDLNPYPEPSWASVEKHDQAWIEQFIENSKLRSEWFDRHDNWEPVPEAYAGKNYSFSYDAMDSLMEFLEQARKDGINFPDYLFDYCREHLEGSE